MNRLSFAPLAVLLTLTYAVHAQSSMPGMPGMNMPDAPAPQSTPSPRMQMPRDMKPETGENAHAHAAEQSVRNSEAQQRPQAAVQPGPGSDAASLQHDTYGEQEFEAPGLQVGSDLPVPEVLGDAAHREPLALQTFEGWADASNPTLAEASSLVERSEAQARQAALPPDPIVGYSGEHLRGGSYGGGENGGFVEQTIVLGGKLGLRRNIYTARAEEEKAGLQAQTFRVHADVERAFYDALTAQAEADVYRRMLANEEDTVRTAHELANLGQQDAPELLDAEVEREQAKVQLEQAERTFLDKFATLASLAGHPGEPATRLEGKLEDVPQLNTGALVGEVMANSPEVRVAQQDVMLAQTRLKDARHESIPNLRVQAGAWWSGEYLEPTTKAAGWMGFAQAGVQLPLWNRNQGNVAAAQADINHAQAEVTRTQYLLKSRAEPLAQQYLAARFQVERYRDQLLPRAERAHQLYVLKYQQMAAAYAEVLISERTTLRLRLTYLQALNAEWMAAVALQNYTLSGGLDAPMSRAASDTMMNVPTSGSE